MQLLHKYPRSVVSLPYLKTQSDSRTPGGDEIIVPSFDPYYPSLGVRSVLWRGPVTRAKKG